MKCELNILCGNKTGHCIKRYMWVKDLDEMEYEIRWELEKYDAVYEYLRIQPCKNIIIATAYNGA